MKDTVLITGGAGFLGSHVANHCLDLGFDVVIIDNLSGGYKQNIPEAATFYEIDIRSAIAVDMVFSKHRPKYVYHLAADARENLSHFTRKHSYETNVIGSVNLINCAVNYDVKCFVFTSSIAVMAGGTPPYQENEAFRPMDSYGIGKAAVEQDLHAALNMFGLNYIVFRPYNIYGPGQNIADKYRNVVGIFMNQIMKGEPLTIFGDGNQKRAFSYIDDVAPHIAKSVMRDELYNNVFFIGGAKPYTVNELADAVGKAFGVVPEIKYLDERHEAKVAYALPDRMQQVFGSAWTPLDLGVRKMAEWAKKVGPMPVKDFIEIEIRKNMPEGW